MQVRPSLDEVLAHRGNETHVALAIELLADTETPISLYAKLALDSSHSFLLESAEGGEKFGRYSFIGFDPALTLEYDQGVATIRASGQPPRIERGDPLAILRTLLSGYRVVPEKNLPPFQGGAVGFLGYDCVRYFEKLPEREAEGPTSEARTPRVEVPEASFLLAETLVIVDHLRHRLHLIDHMPLSGDRRVDYEASVDRLSRLVDRIRAPSESLPIVEFSPLMGSAAQEREAGARDAYLASVREAKAAIAAGEIFQVVLSERFSVETSVSSFSLYRALRALNPSPYLFHVRLGDLAVVGASPEVLVRVQAGEILLRPIAGTRPRASDPDQDAALEAELISNEKELAEHRMLLDLGRNDVGRVAELGTVSVEHPFHVERYSHVMHMVSDVRAKMASDRDAFDVLRACFPAGTVSGAPKVRAMEIIDRLEPTKRGIYGGAVGYFDLTGNMDMAITIRTLVVTPTHVHIQAGAGIVYDSEPEREYEECLNKARAAFVALDMASKPTRGT